MTIHTLKELQAKNLITQKQFDWLEPIYSGKVVSIFYELRTVLYLGVMLFTTGAGILIYQNIGDIGHVISIGLLTALMTACFWYVIKNEMGYTHEQIQSPIPYYDYILLLGCLLFVSIQGYLQVQYELLTDQLGISTLITAGFFFYAAYRFDHIGVLSLAITAFASFWGITISPQKWDSGNFFAGSHLHLTAIIFATVMMAITTLLDKRGIKRHFTFTYHNLGLLIYFCGCVAGLFINEHIYLLYVVLIYGGGYFAWHLARTRKSFLFLLYAFLAAYIATTYLLAETIFDSEPVLWFWYSLLSCGGFIYLVIRFRTFFKR